MVSGLWLQVDASRRRNDPHKRGKVPVSMVRLRCKSLSLIHISVGIFDRFAVVQLYKRLSAVCIVGIFRAPSVTGERRCV